MKIKKFLDIYIPTETCNLRCHYCYIALQNKFNNRILKIGHTPKEIRQAFSVERLGGRCLINLCAGGETLLSEEIVPIIYEFLKEGHYVMVVTNGTISKRFEEFATWKRELKERLFFKFSLHYLELKRLGLLENFASNVNMMRENNCSISVEVTTNDELIPLIDELKAYCKNNFGAFCHLTIARDDCSKEIKMLTELSQDDYRRVWETFESDLLNYKLELYGVKRKEYCYAGAWSYYINIKTGDVRQCYCGKIIDNVYKSPKKKLREIPIGKKCKFAYCYNGHAFLALGNIPHLDKQHFDDERNRITKNGEEWLTSEMKEAMHTKLEETNREISNYEKIVCRLKEFIIR